jgi:tRNASer (uridine44-2'-O)-methyltransferase
MPFEIFDTYFSSPHNSIPYKPGTFLIGNHADELTPWIPLLSAIIPDSSFIIIPCCMWTIEGYRFTLTNFVIQDEFLNTIFPWDLASEGDDETLIDPDWHQDIRNEISTIHPLLRPFYAPTPTYIPEIKPSFSQNSKVPGGRYFSYQLYLAKLVLRCGFIPEREALRIPSTKNFGIVGRRRIWDLGKGEREEMRLKRWVREQVEEMVESARGKWKPREEGKGKCDAGHF